MSIAWATVVVVVLLTPGACFFLGLYAPQLLQRESVAISPLGQLAGIVCISFFLHGAFFLLINGFLATHSDWIVPVSFDHVFPILHADADPIKDRQDAIGSLQEYVPQILVYFLSADLLASAAGFLVGFFIERQVFPFKYLARHPWLFHVHDNLNSFTLVSALSKIQENGQIIMYEGQLRDIYLKADGNISYVTLSSAASRILALPTRPPVAEAPQLESGVKFTPGRIDWGPEWEIAQNSSTSIKASHRPTKLHLAGSEISNFYFQKVSWSDSLTTEGLKDLSKLADKYIKEYESRKTPRGDSGTTDPNAAPTR